MAGGGSKSTSSNSSVTSNVDSRQVNSYDNRVTSDSHNVTMVDPGAAAIAEKMAQFGTDAGSNALEAQRIMAGLAGQVGDTSARLAETSSANALQVSEHMLNLTGELIDKVATGTESMVASQNAAGAAAASIVKSATSATDSLKTQILAGLAVVAVVALLRK